jgi:hypothetical protein
LLEVLLVLKIVKLPLEMKNPTQKRAKDLVRTTTPQDYEASSWAAEFHRRR